MGIALLLVFALSLLTQGSVAAAVGASSSQDEEVCDPLADYFLGMEDYPEAIRRHQLVIKDHPDNALAHYHLGFSYGLMGEHQQELAEYHDAIDLGLDDWQLFLNLGLLYLEAGNAHEAMQVLKLATLLGPDRVGNSFQPRRSISAPRDAAGGGAGNSSLTANRTRTSLMSAILWALSMPRKASSRARRTPGMSWLRRIPTMLLRARIW